NLTDRVTGSVGVPPGNLTVCVLGTGLIRELETNSHRSFFSASCLIWSTPFSSASCLGIPDHHRQVVNDVGYGRLNEIQRNLRKRPQVLKGVPDSLGQRVVIGVNSSNRCNQLVVLSLEVVAVGFKAANDALQLVNRGLLFLDLAPQALKLGGFLVHLVTDFKGVNSHHFCTPPIFNERPTSTCRPRLLHQPEIPCQSHREEP